MAETSEKKVEGEYNLLRLLERNGLTRIDNTNQMVKIEASAHHRIHVEDRYVVPPILTLHLALHPNFNPDRIPDRNPDRNPNLHP